MGTPRQWQVGLDFLASPCGLSWASPYPNPPMLPAGRKSTQWALTAVSRLWGRREAQGTLLCRRKDIFPIRAVPLDRGCPKAKRELPVPGEGSSRSWRLLAVHGMGSVTTDSPSR